MQSSFSIEKLHRFLTEKLGRNAGADTEASSPDLYDLSYEDALLDPQIRQYFKAEYGLAQPPSGVFPRLLAAIRAHEAGDTAPQGTRTSAAFLTLYRVLRTSTVQRLVSGGIAAALVIAVLSSNSAHFLRGTAVSLVTEYSTPTAKAAIGEEDTVELATSRDNRYVIHRPSIASDPEFYDPVELRLPVRTESASGLGAPPRWQRFGGQ